MPGFKCGGLHRVEYRAKDSKLGREVAIKTLPAALARDHDRLTRFEREAKLLAALNHAHIAGVYGLDEHEGTQYLAMELVEGETLEEMLRRGRLPIDDALRFALQIAAALEAAHEKGVVHRDLKPANIMVTADGQVKVLDFGLAKAFTGDPNEASPLHSPALSLAMTQQGLILGTRGYMSPEQASGQATDQRADIWAFGVVLYEMLTGLPLFGGESVPHIMADILRTEPDWSRLPKNLHPRLRLLLERCLRKKVRARYHSIADVRVDIEDILSDPEDATSAPTAQSAARRLVPLAAVFVIGAVVAGIAGWSFKPAPSNPFGVQRLSLMTPANRPVSFYGYPTRSLALSPDGTQLVYTGTQTDATGRLIRRGLELRSLASLDQVRRDSGDYVAQLATSPSGTLAYLPAADTAAELGLVGRDGSFEKLGLPSGNYCLPRVSPDGHAVAFVEARGQKKAVRIYDLQRGTTTSSGTRDRGELGIAWRPGGQSLVLSSGASSANGLFLVNLDGTEQQLVASPTGSILRAGSWSPDGNHFSYVVQSGSQHEIWVLTMSRTPDEKPAALPLITGAAGAFNPQFSPDGRWLAFVSDESGRPEIYIQRYPQGERLPVSTSGGLGPVWSPDGTELFFEGNLDGGALGLMAVSVAPEGDGLRLGKPVGLFDLQGPPTESANQYDIGGNVGAAYDVLPDGQHFVMVRRDAAFGTREIVLVQNLPMELSRLLPAQ